MRRGESIKNFFIFALVGAFALLALAAIVLSGRVYSGIAEHSGENAAVRTTLNYIAGKVRAHDQDYGVQVGEQDGMQVLCLREKYGDVPYRTDLYCMDGVLYESFQKASPFQTFDAALGERIADAEAVSFELSENMLRVEVTQAGRTYSLHLALSAEGDEA